MNEMKFYLKSDKDNYIKYLEEENNRLTVTLEAYRVRLEDEYYSEGVKGNERD